MDIDIVNKLKLPEQRKYFIDVQNVKLEECSEYKLTEFDEVNKELQKAKSQLDKIPERDFNSFRPVMDMYHELKRQIAKDFNAQHVTNAWLKIVELVQDFKLINYGKTFKLFANAELPGGFVFAINHLAKTNNTKLNWKASSLIEEINGMRGALGDFYELYSRNLPNWLMGAGDIGGNGDVQTTITIDLFKDYFKSASCKVDLYTSDIGMDVSGNFNVQERLNAHIDLGQILCGIVSVKKGGAMVVKQYTFFEAYTISLIIIVASLFDEFYIAKPLTSRPTNSEIYLVGKGFKGCPRTVYNILYKRLDNFNLNPFVSEEQLRQMPAYEQLVNAGNDIFSTQVEFLNEFYSFYSKYFQKRFVLSKKLDNTKYDMRFNFLQKYQIKSLDSEDWLNAS